MTDLSRAGISLMLKGPSGSGKTEGALSLPGPIYLVYADVNLATVRTAISKGRDIEFWSCTSWSDYQNVFIPKVLNRTLPARTLVVDTIDFLTDRMWSELQGPKQRLTQPDFGTGLANLMRTTYVLASSTIPKGDHPGYNIVVTAHLKDVTTDDGSLMKVQPAIMGTFKDKVEDYFDHVYLCEAETKARVVDGKATKERQFKVYTINPDRYNSCKAPASMPPEILIPAGKTLFEVCNEYWGLTSDGNQ